MRFGRNVTASLMAAMMTLSSVVSPLSMMDVNAEEVTVNEVTTQAEESKTLIDLNTQWTYYEGETDPVTTGNDRTAWTRKEFDISGWKTSPKGTEAKFGAKNGAIDSADGYTPTILLDQYKEDGKNTEAFFFRTTVNVDKTKLDAEDVVKGSVIYDDAALVYINGELVAEFDNKQYEKESEKFTANMQYGGHNSSTKEESFKVDADVFEDGENIIAVELHQGRPTSSDIYFEMPSLGVEEFVAEQKAVSLSVGEDATERNITWYTNLAEAGKVQYAVKDGETFPENYTEVDAVTADTNDGDFISNKAVMTGLEANKEYVYRLVNGENVSETYSFKTTGTKDFNFLLAGDPQIGASGNVTSDTNGWENTLNKVMDNFPNSAFLLSAGDQVNTASNEAQYEGYLEHDALTSLPTATIIGNHDSGSAAYTQHFNNPNVTSYGATKAGTDYWYVYNNVLFMHLNSNSGSVAEHRELIKEAVEANPDVDWKVVSFHHSIYSVASHAKESDILNRRETYVPVFEEFDIDVVLMGHDHVYARSYMMDGHTPVVTEKVESSAMASDGILYITANSASGSKFYGISGEYEYAAVQSQERVPNISNVEVTEDSFKITTYRTTDMSVVDEFTVNKSDTEKAKEAAKAARAAKEEAQAALEAAKTAKEEAETEAAKAAGESADAKTAKEAAETAKAAATKAQEKAAEAQEKAAEAQEKAAEAQAAATTEAEKAEAAKVAAEAAQTATEAAKVAAETAQAAAEAAQSAAEKAKVEAQVAAEAAKADRENAAKAEAAAKAEREAAEAAKAAAEAAKAAAEAAAEKAQTAAEKTTKATVTPKKATLSKVTSTKKRQVKVTWKKDTKASGYQVVCAANKSFTKKVKRITVNKKAQTSLKINKLTSKKKVYVKVRSYKTVNGKKVYGKYSAVKSVKVR